MAVVILVMVCEECVGGVDGHEGPLRKAPMASVRQ